MATPSAVRPSQERESERTRLVADQDVEGRDGGQDLIVDGQLGHAEALQLVSRDDGDQTELRVGVKLWRAAIAMPAAPGL